MFVKQTTDGGVHLPNLMENKKIDYPQAIVNIARRWLVETLREEAREAKHPKRAKRKAEKLIKRWQLEGDWTDD